MNNIKTFFTNLDLGHYLVLLGLPAVLAFLVTWQTSGLGFDAKDLDTAGKTAFASFIAVLIALLKTSPNNAAKFKELTVAKK